MSERETARVTVRTSVPKYQKVEWAEHADELDMNLSEFVRSMVQAGRRGFTSDPTTGAEMTDTTGDAQAHSNGHREHLLDALADGEYVSWEELVDETIDDIEGKVETELQSLIAANRVEHSPRKEAYRLVE